MGAGKDGGQKGKRVFSLFCHARAGVSAHLREFWRVDLPLLHRRVVSTFALCWRAGPPPHPPTLFCYIHTGPFSLDFFTPPPARAITPFPYIWLPRLFCAARPVHFPPARFSPFSALHQHGRARTRVGAGAHGCASAAGLTRVTV